RLALADPEGDALSRFRRRVFGRQAVDDLVGGRARVDEAVGAEVLDEADFDRERPLAGDEVLGADAERDRPLGKTSVDGEARSLAGENAPAAFVRDLPVERVHRGAADEV